MQQTEHYKLNLIETGDPLSPAPLNENTQKTEAELDSLATQTATLDQRVVKLESCRMTMGWYLGNSDNNGLLIDLGERPAAVLVMYCAANQSYNAMVIGSRTAIDKAGECLRIEDNGFRVTYSLNADYKGGYFYLAFFGDWVEKDFPNPPPKPV